jgi:hypothetical protein
VIIRRVTTSELGRDECLRLSSTVTVGRLIYTVSALPAVEPVRSVLDGQTVVFRATYTEKIAGQGEHSVVAFEADQLDPDTQVQALVRPTAGQHVIEIEMQLITGIRIG